MIEKFFDMLGIIATLTILFAVAVCGLVMFSMPALIVMFIVSILG